MQQQSIPVAEILARLAVLEDQAEQNAARASELAADSHGQRRFSEGELTAVKGIQKIIREMAGLPVEGHIV